MQQEREIIRLYAIPDLLEQPDMSESYIDVCCRRWSRCCSSTAPVCRMMHGIKYACTTCSWSIDFFQLRKPAQHKTVRTERIHWQSLCMGAQGRLSRGETPVSRVATVPSATTHVTSTTTGLRPTPCSQRQQQEKGRK